MMVRGRRPCVTERTPIGAEERRTSDAGETPVGPRPYILMIPLFSARLPMSQPTVSTSQAPAPVRNAPTATEMYEAARLARTELRNQRTSLEGQRRDLQQQLQRSSNSVDTKSLEARLVALDARQLDVDKQLAVADLQVASTAGVPGVIIEQRPPGPDIPPEAVLLGGLGMAMVLLIPVSIAYARRIWRRAGQSAPAQIPAELFDRMASIERGVEAVAIEVERMGEGQRFVTQLLSEQAKRHATQALPSGPQ